MAKEEPLNTSEAVSKSNSSNEFSSFLNSEADNPISALVSMFRTMVSASVSSLVTASKDRVV